MLSLLLLIGGLSWLLLLRTPSPEVVPAAPRAVAPPKPQLTPTKPGASSVQQIAPRLPEAGVSSDVAVPQSSQAEPGTTGKSEASESRRGPAVESARKKPKARAPSAPAEVETEWK
jgi:hypothetical protein